MSEETTYTYEELHAMTVSQLREVAKGRGHAALKGYTTMHKEHLLPALCEALDIEAHDHHEVVGIDKAKVKARIKELKMERAAALEAGDSQQLRRVRRRIRGLKRKIRKATV
jgi:deoxyribodipyrimidine photolyase-like uncharacterized protein